MKIYTRTMKKSIFLFNFFSYSVFVCYLYFTHIHTQSSCWIFVLYVDTQNIISFFYTRYIYYVENTVFFVYYSPTKYNVISLTSILCSILYAFVCILNLLLQFFRCFQLCLSTFQWILNTTQFNFVSNSLVFSHVLFIASYLFSTTTCAHTHIYRYKIWVSTLNVCV